jgi:hypothetical protein
VLVPEEPSAANRRRSADELLAELRGTRGLRPKIDRGLAGGLRAWLDDGIHERLGRAPGGPLRLSSRAFAPERVTVGSMGLLRGAVVAQLVRLHVAGAVVTVPLSDALDAMRGSGRDASLCDQLDALDPDELAQLSAEVSAHNEVLRDALPHVPSRWSPRCGVRQAVVLAGGAVTCRGVVDLALGSTGGTRACVCLIDVTTATLGPHHERVCNYLALLETIRTGEQPLRVAAISTADGCSIVRDVDNDLLTQAVTDLLQVIPVPVAA